MKVLLYGGVHCDSEFKREQTILWARLTRHLNPDTHIALFDTASPFDPIHFIPKKLHIDVFRFNDNPGHMAKGGGDGAGRTHMAGIERAIENEYDYAVHLGVDFLLAKPIKELVDRMAKSGVQCAALPLSQYSFPEWELSAFDVQWARDTEFVQRYGWDKIRGPYPTVERPSQLRKFIPEWRLFDLAGDDLWLIPWSGIRNDQNQVNAANLSDAFPYHPPVWVHMFSNMHLAHRFLELNEITLP